MVGHQGQMNAAVAVVAAQMNAQQNGQSAQQQQSPQGGYLAPYGYSPYSQDRKEMGMDAGGINGSSSQDAYTAYDMSQPKMAHSNNNNNNNSTSNANSPPNEPIQSRYSYGYSNNGATTPIKQEVDEHRDSPQSPYQMYANGQESLKGGDIAAKHALQYSNYGAYAGVAAMASQQYQTNPSMEANIDPNNIIQEQPRLDSRDSARDEDAYVDVSQAHL